MPAKAIHKSDVNCQVIARLPLNIERAIHCIGKLVLWRINAQVEGYGAPLNRRRVGQDYA